MKRAVVEKYNLSDYVDETVKYVSLEPIENKMNEADPEHLKKYLDPEFFNATPDSKTIDTTQLEIKDREHLDIEFDVDTALEELLESETMKQEILAPREYQFELYQKALKENVITVLDTGTGKTLISVMLIKEMVRIEQEARLTRREAKLAFFLVERVPLVFQQAEVIRANCDVKLEIMCGEMDVDNWTEKKWKLIFEESDICVMTAQIFLDCLRHGFISLEQAHLMVFDECHHATKKHSFNLIMREFYDRCPIDKRPKIFGMTASPMHARSSVEYSVSQLEKNLNSRVYTAKNMDNSHLGVILNIPKEVTFMYDPSPNHEETPTSIRIREKLASINRYKRCFVITSDILKALGPWCCDRMWKIMLSDLERKMSTATQDLDRDALIDEDLALKETHEFIDAIEFPRNPDSEDPKLFTNKLILLIRLLTVFKSVPGFCGIIFVERRHTAIAIQCLIESLDDLDYTRCGILIGHGSTDEGDVQMTFKEQNKTIEKFKTGELNLLIATNVAEEGLDIQPCNIVIRFDFFHTLISYIQSRGRARKVDSKYIILSEKGNGSQQGTLEEFGELEQKMKNFCQLLPEERNVANKYSVGLSGVDSDDEYSSDEDYMESALIIPETNAVVTKQNAVSLLHRYCSSLPSDTFCVLKPIFEIIGTGEGYLCKVTLPSNAAIQEAESCVCRSKYYAKASAALQACSQLRVLGAFDAHMMPHNLRQEILGEMAPQYDENGFIIGSRRRHGMYEKRTPKFWDREAVDIEEDEVADIEDNPDLLMAQIHSTTLENISTTKKDVVGTEAGPGDLLEVVNKVNMNGPHSVMKPIVDSDGKLLDSYSNHQAEMANGLTENLLALDLNSNTSDKSLIQEDTKTKDRPDGSLPAAPNTHMKEEVDGIAIAENSLKEAELTEGTETEEIEVEVEEELGEGPFPCWFTIFEVELEENKFDEIPYRRLCLVSKKPFPSLPKLKLFHQSIPFYVHLRNIETELSFDRERILLLSNYMMKLLLALINKEFKCPIVDIPYYIVPLLPNTENSPFEEMTATKLEDLIDWEEVNSITASKIEPFSIQDTKSSTDTIIIDTSDNLRRYFVTNVRKNLSPSSPVPGSTKTREAGYATFADYYKEKKAVELDDLNQPLLEVKRLKKVMNFLYPGRIADAQVKGPLMALAVPELCQRFFISASVYQAALMIPSIMTRVDSLLLCRQAKEIYDLPINDMQMLEAYTAPSASMELDYERLETLGDSLLKFIATIRLYINFPFSNEGELHHLRIRVICNRALYRSAKRLKFYRYVTSQAFNRRYWRPPHFTSLADNPETMEDLKYHKLSDKTLADIVEASLGAAYISNGLEGGLHAAIQLQIPFDNITTWSDFEPTFIESRKKIPPRAEARALRLLNIPRIQDIVGKNFKTPLLLVEALTHASLPNSTSPCYQRLEFLGDAILDFLVIKYLFAKYPDGDPGIITDLKDSCVNNHVLGIICIETGLYKHIIHYSGKLVRAIESFVSEVDKVKENGEAVGEYWTDFNIPKVLSDVVESMLGAVFVDAGFDLAPCEDLFKKWFLPIFDNHVTPELIKIHPLRKLLTDLQRFGCDGFMLRNHSAGETGPESQKCVIFLHDKPLACGSDWNIKTARRHAAAKASQRLMDEPDLLESVCNCRVSMIKRGLLVEDAKEVFEDED